MGLHYASDALFDAQLTIGIVTKGQESAISTASRDLHESAIGSNANVDHFGRDGGESVYAC
ncbi:MAG: uncharacterized protein KVP18_000760 [Porospora cf. gigantea A]|uniref:uncharacterized protein n=1 Tax=Porospora cf. gigantea A TaxID=2853593 RepID=UPI00355AC118|nr:MAG: hypothetical protein KVP18_000760 [Porospora cf. gigantea A]